MVHVRHLPKPIPYADHALRKKLKNEAGKSKRSANAELVARLERSLADSSNEIDLRILFETLERLSLRNPAMRYSFGINLGGKLDERLAEIVGGKWALEPEPGDALAEFVTEQSSKAVRSAKAKP